MSDDLASERREDNSFSPKTYISLACFVFYSVIYAGFVLVNCMEPRLMGMDVGCLNLAIIYGFALIALAVLLALLYNYICAYYEQEAYPEGTTFMVQKNLRQGEN